ncbi:MAG TPA: hypothetical protein VGV89_00255 [Thermoplasmata archaeon]|nr:hypothetical protein [Thermoplasmata archaeon]
MESPTLRYALWALVAVLLASPLATIATAQAATPTYTLSGYVDQPNLISPMAAGVTVELISGSTHQTLTTTTGAGGFFQFTTSSTSGALVPGWWGLWVPAQAHLHLGGDTEWSVVPTLPGPQYQFLSASNLTSKTFQVTTSAALFQLTGTVAGTVSQGGSPVAGAALDILDPYVPGFDLNNTTSNATGAFSFRAPAGTWILQTTEYGPQTTYNTTQVVVGLGKTTVNPNIQTYLAQGYIYRAGSSARVAGGGNVTLYDTATGAIMSEPTVPGFYSIGTYPAGFTGPGTETFRVIVNPDGYGTTSYLASVSPSSRTVVRNVFAPAEAPPAQYSTDLTFSPTFGKLSVVSHAYLGNDSVFQDLANATVGQLWAQLGLDFNGGSLSFDGTNAGEVSAFTNWVNSSGPFFGAGESALQVNGTTFGQPTNYTFTAPNIPSRLLSLGDSTPIWMNWTQNYNETSSVIGGGSGQVYNVAFNFQHPNGPEAINYTIHLPTGYTLAANTPKPSNALILPAGPGRTYTSFTLSAKDVPAGTPLMGSANFTVVKYSGFTAIVNVSVNNFAFSKLNVLNSTRSNYTAVVGVGQNTTFSAENSTYPDGTNGTLFHWDFGGYVQTTDQDVAYHTYGAAGDYKGNVVVTSSGGNTSQANFTILVGSSAPTAAITDNASANQTKSSGGVTYLLVNWSTVLHFNVTASSSPLAGNLTGKGVLSDAIWSAKATKYNYTGNYTANGQVNSNFTVSFLGAGLYFHNVTIGGARVAFYGWWYNISLTVWDGQGHKASATLPVLVNDVEKPVPVVTLRNSASQNISSSGIVEASNHTAEVIFDGQYSTDPHNGSVVRYDWNVSNTAASSGFPLYHNTTSTKWTYWLPPQTKAYTVNLTVFDRAGNHQYSTTSLTVSVNASTRPVLSVGNLSAPSTMTDGSSYTIWGNITNTVGKNSTASGVTVAFYLLNPGGTGSRDYIVASSAVKFYSYSSTGVVGTTPLATGTLSTLGYNVTVRAEITWSPSKTGSYILYMNASATNQFGSPGPNVASQPVTLNANPVSTYILYGIIAAVVIGLIVAVIFYSRWRRAKPPAGKGGSSSTSKSGLERGGKKPADDEDDEDEDSS